MPSNKFCTQKQNTATAHVYILLIIRYIINFADITSSISELPVLTSNADH